MARKKVKLNNDVMAAVPLSSMIDVVFLLLIYFIFTQKPVVEDVYLALDLPAPNAASASSSKPPAILRIDVVKWEADKGKPSDGYDNDEEITKLMDNAKSQAEVNAIRKKERVYFFVNTSGDAGGTPMLLPDLEKYLTQVFKAAPDTTIVLNCGPNAKHKKLIRFLNLCDKLKKDLNLKELNLNLMHNAAIRFVPDPPEKRKPQ